MIPDITIEVGFTTIATGSYWHIGDTARGKIGTAAVGPDEGLWADVTDYAMSWSTSRGSNRVDSPQIRYEAGKCSITLDNTDRRFDPENLSGPYVSGGVTQVTPMRPVRIRATYNSITYDVWRGFADSWTVEYPAPGFSTCTLRATDGTKVLAAYDRTASGSVGAGEDTGARVSRILDSASWPATDRVISTGDSTVQATTLDGSAWTELQSTNDAELGELYLDGAGRVVFRARTGILTDSRSNTTQATFDDDGTDLRYASVTVEYDDDTLRNIVRVTRTGGVEQTAQDAASIADYLTKVFPLAGIPLDSDTQSAGLAGWLLYQMKDPELRFSEIEILPFRDEATLYPQALSREIGDRITIIRRPPGGGSAIEKDCFIRGIFHSCPQNHEWKTRWVLQSAERYSFWTIGHATLGRVGLNALA